LIGGEISDVILKNKKRRAKILKQDNQNNIAKGHGLELDELIHIKKLTEGQFGPIHLVVEEPLDKKDSELKTYVIKCINKKIIKELNLTHHIE
jgi:hypothetical protein